MLERLLKTESVRAVMACVVIRRINGASLFVSPHSAGTTSSKFRDDANDAERVFARKVLRMAVTVFVLDRTLIMCGALF